jgi:hypothetical protein
MARLDPLTGTLEVPTETPKPKRKRAAKPAAAKAEPGLAPTKKNAARVPQNAPHAAPQATPATHAAQQAARLPLATCALLFKLSDLAAAQRALNGFIVWCNARPELADWRAAWALYGASLATPTAPTAPAKIIAFPAAGRDVRRSWGNGVLDRLT